LEADYNKFTQSGWNNIVPWDVIRAVSDGETTASEIADKINDWNEQLNSGTRGIGKVCNDLSGDGEETTGGNWQNPSILTLISDNPKEYTLTSYGELLIFIFIDQDGEYDELHNWLLEPQRCGRKQLITDVVKNFEYGGELKYNPSEHGLVDVTQTTKIG
jgi:hypothetical protein